MGCCCSRKKKKKPPEDPRNVKRTPMPMPRAEEWEMKTEGTQGSSLYDLSLHSSASADSGSHLATWSGTADSSSRRASAPIPRPKSARVKPPVPPIPPIPPIPTPLYRPLPAPVVKKHTEVREFRVMVPLTGDEFERAYLHAVTEGSKRETGGGGGLEVLFNRPFRPGELTLPPDFAHHQGITAHKIYHIRHHAPLWLKPFMHTYDIEAVHEMSWNSYPYSRTIIFNPKWKHEDFLITVSSMAREGDDGRTENALHLSPDQLKIRQVTNLDITDDTVMGKDYKVQSDPKLFRSVDGKRGPYRPGWELLPGPRLCSYKVVTVTLRWHFLESKGRTYLLKTFYPRNMARLHREAVCSYDHWSPCSMGQLLAAEAAAQADMDRLRNHRDFSGSRIDDHD